VHGDYANAVQRLDGVISTTSSDAAAINLRGVAEMMAGHLEEAKRTFDAAIARDPEMPEPRFNRGVVLLKQGRPAEAGAAFAWVYEKAPGLKAAAAYHHALADESDGKLADARSWLDRALGANADYDDAIVARGLVHEKLGEYAEAAVDYRKYLDRHADSIVATLRFGVVAHAAGHPDIAIRYLRKVVAAAPDSPEAAEATKFLVMWE
jgi:tetratricopeptide (TPR) repeat protein